MVTTTRYLTFVAVIAACLAMASPAGAKPGDLDPSFAGTGNSIVPLEKRGFGFVSALQPDGKLVVAGLTHTEPYPSCVAARFLTNGALDPGFGTNGVSILGVGDADVCEISSIAIRPDGRILLGGTIDPGGSTPAMSTVIGITTAGSPDSSWSTDGLYINDFLTGDESFSDISLLPDGKLLVSTQAVNGDPSMAERLTVDGEIDPSFAASGQGQTGNGIMHKIHGFADGRFLVAGKVVSGGEKFCVGLLAGSGGLFDTSFGGGVGRTCTSLPGPDSGVKAMVLQPDGKIILGGSGYSNGKYRGVLLRFTVDGQLDPTFGAGGAVLASFRDEDRFNDVAVAPDGKIVAVGSSVLPGVGGTVSLVARYNADGSLDSGFGSGGLVFDVFGTGNAVANSVTIASDSKISVVGTNNGTNNFARLSAARLIGADPVLTPLGAAISSPSKKKLKAKKAKKFAGTASGDGLAKVQIALLKTDSKLLKKKRRCLQLTSNKAKLKKYKAVKKKCVPAKWLTATGTTSWSYKLKKALKPGKYTLYVRSVNTLGVAQVTPAKMSFTLTK